MAAPTDPQLVRFTPAELIDAVRDGRIRYPNAGHPSSADTVAVLDGIQRLYPQRSLPLWRNPELAAPTPWLLEGERDRRDRGPPGPFLRDHIDDRQRRLALLHVIPPGGHPAPR